MTRTCPNCGYVTEHIKHFQNCGIPKADWPEHFKVKGAPIPKSYDEVTVYSTVSAPVVTQGQPGPAPQPTFAYEQGACCACPKEVHIEDAEGFPPTCMGTCEDDEHSWRPAVIDNQTIYLDEVGGFECDCGFEATNARALRMHRQRAKVHREAVNA